MRPLTLSQSAEIAEFAETYAKERFGRSVRLSVRGLEISRPSGVPLAYGALTALVICVSAAAWLIK